MTTRGDVARQCAQVATPALAMALAERTLPAPSAVKAWNDAERELILAALKLAVIVDDLSPAETPGWLRRERAAAS